MGRTASPLPSPPLFPLLHGLNGRNQRHEDRLPREFRTGQRRATGAPLAGQWKLTVDRARLTVPPGLLGRGSSARDNCLVSGRNWISRLNGIPARGAFVSSARSELRFGARQLKQERGIFPRLFNYSRHAGDGILIAWNCTLQCVKFRCSEGQGTGATRPRTSGTCLLGRSNLAAEAVGVE